MARRIGMLVNPDAGLGGKLGFKGSDGRAQEARDAGAEDRSGPRMMQALLRCEGRLDDIQIITCSGRMGANWCPLEHTVVFETPQNTRQRPLNLQSKLCVMQVLSCYSMRVEMGLHVTLLRR